MPTPTVNEWLRRVLLALGVALLLALLFAPPLGAFLAWSRLPEAGAMLEVRRGAAVLQQAQAPGSEISDTLHGVIRWRVLFPWLGYWLGLPGWALFGLAHVGAVAVLGYLAAQLRRAGATWRVTAGALVGLGAASWFFTATGWLGYYDSWLALGLLVLVFARSPWAVGAASLLTPWVDERVVLAAPLAWVLRYAWTTLVERTEAGGAGSLRPEGPHWAGLDRREWVGGYLVPAGLLAGFAVVRLALLPGSGGAGWSEYWAKQDNFGAPFWVMAWGVWEGLRVGWLFVGVALWWAWRARPAVGALLAAGLLATLVAGLVLAQDFSRSMTMALPVAVVGVLVAVRARAAWLPRALAIAAPVALLLPAHHVMSDRVNPIYYLYHEIYVLANPPRALQAEHHELAAIHLMERGDQAGAEAKLTLAIRLAENPANACKHRGLLRAGAGRWREARADFEAMVRAEPKEPEGWFLRAQAAAALGELTAARADLQQALSLAPPGWEKRPDVERFRARLGR